MGPYSTAETGRTHRYELVIMGGAGIGSSAGHNIRSNVLKIDRPAFESDVVTLHHKQNEIKIPGKHRWGSVNIVVYDVFSNNTNTTAEDVYKWWNEGILKYNEQVLNDLNEMKRMVEIKMLDGFERTIWAYRLYGAWPSKVAPDTMDYSSSNISLTTLTIAYDGVEESTG